MTKKEQAADGLLDILKYLRKTLPQNTRGVLWYHKCDRIVQAAIAAME